MREAVKKYLDGFTELVALERVFNKEDVSGLADARQIIDKAFENMETLLEGKGKKKNPKNEAR